MHAQNVLTASIQFDTSDIDVHAHYEQICITGTGTAVRTAVVFQVLAFTHTTSDMRFLSFLSHCPFSDEDDSLKNLRGRRTH